MKQMLKEDDQVSEYMDITQENLIETFDQLTQMVHGLEDVEGTWVTNVREINKKIMATAVKNGISKDKHSRFKF